jgi:ribonucleoside-triphosphate reductase
MHCLPAFHDLKTITGKEIYDKFGVPIPRMGCRAKLSPWYPKGGFKQADETDIPVIEGRFNLGAISLHFPMIAAQAQHENRDFYEVLTEYLELVRKIHQRTFSYIAHKKAGTNPLGFCQGGFLNGYKDPEEEIGEDLLRPMTLSFGITALNETSILMTGKSIREDNTFAIEVLKFMNDYVKRIKEEDNLGYAIYGTPAESLCGLQIEQFRKKYGIINGVSDRAYTSNSFHCGVWEDITPIEKQDIEYPMFHLCNGGNIQYCRYITNYNIDAIKTLVKRAMKMGFYEGVNLQLDYCEDCGHQFIDSDKCPKCGSEHLTRIERMNGYLGFSKVKGRTMYADHKLKEFADRKSM